jgi:hypothetical protein
LVSCSQSRKFDPIAILFIMLYYRFMPLLSRNEAPQGCEVDIVQLVGGAFSHHRHRKRRRIWESDKFATNSTTSGIRNLRNTPIIGFIMHHPLILSELRISLHN